MNYYIMKQPVIKRIYEDDDWIIDLINGKLRISYFENGHYVDEVVLTKEQFIDKND